MKESIEKDWNDYENGNKRIQTHDPHGPFCTPKTVQVCASAWINCWTKKLWKMRTGPPGLRAAGLLGRQAIPGHGLLGHGPAFSKTPTVSCWPFVGQQSADSFCCFRLTVFLPDRAIAGIPHCIQKRPLGKWRKGQFSPLLLRGFGCMQA